MSRETRIFVMPADGRRVRFPAPDGRVLANTGAMVPQSQYWLRRVRDQDVVITERPTRTAPEAAAPPEEG